MAIRTTGAIKLVQLGRGRFQLARELPPDSDVGAAQYEVDLVGTKDGHNRTFTSPVAISMGANDKPRALLTWRRTRQFYSADNPPAPGRYTVVLPDTVILGSAPAAGDYLAWDQIETP